MKRITQGIFSLAIGLALFSSSGCVLIYMKMNGFKMPRPENRYELNKALLHYRVDTLNSFLVKIDTLAIQKGTITLSIGHYNIYDHNGYLIWPPNDKACFAPAYVYLKTYDRDHHTIYESAKNLDKCLAEIRNIDGSDVNRDSTWNDDVYCLATWSKFAGKGNDQLYWADSAFKALPNLKIRMLKVNQDFIAGEVDHSGSTEVSKRKKKKAAK
jgi:hypothetical protein